MKEYNLKDFINELKEIDNRLQNVPVFTGTTDSTKAVISLMDKGGIRCQSLLSAGARDFMNKNPNIVDYENININSKLFTIHPKDSKEYNLKYYIDKPLTYYIKKLEDLAEAPDKEGV